MLEYCVHLQEQHDSHPAKTSQTASSITRLSLGGYSLNVLLSSLVILNIQQELKDESEQLPGRRRVQNQTQCPYSQTAPKTLVQVCRCSRKYPKEESHMKKRYRTFSPYHHRASLLILQRAEEEINSSVFTSDGLFTCSPPSGSCSWREISRWVFRFRPNRRSEVDLRPPGGDSDC